MNPFNYRSGPTLTSHSNHTIFFSRNEIYSNVGRRRAGHSFRTRITSAV